MHHAHVVVDEALMQLVAWTGHKHVLKPAFETFLLLQNLGAYSQVLTLYLGTRR
jgi:hypothetical protein